MISEASCDTEDWSNDAEDSAFQSQINYILFHIFHNISVYLMQ